MNRIACLTVPCPSHTNFNVKLYYFIHADAVAAVTNAGDSAIALPVHTGEIEILNGYTYHIQPD